MNKIQHATTLLLMLIACSAAAQTSLQHPFIVSYWAKAKNDTVGTVRFSDYDPSQLKLIRRQPSAQPQWTTSWQLTGQQILPSGSAATPAMPQQDNAESEVCIVKDNQVTVLQFATQVKGNYTADDGFTRDIDIETATTARATIKAGLVNWSGEAEAMNNVMALQPFVSVTGYNPQTVHVRQQFLIGPQTVTFEWSYEDYGLLKTAKGLVALPFLQPDIPELVSIDAQETEASQQASRRLAPINIKADSIPAAAHISNLQGESKTYEVTARFRQRFTMSNQPEQQSFQKEFDVKYTVTLDNKLVDVTYEKDYEWTPAHDNLPWMSYYKVHRTRTYSTGEKEVDTFVHRYGYMVSLEHTMYAWGKGGYGDSEFTFADGRKVVYHKENSSYDGFTTIYSYKTGSPDLNLHWETEKDQNQWEGRGDLSNYESDIFGHEGKPLRYDPENPIEGWYDRGIYRVNLVRLFLASGLWIRGYEIVIKFYDRIFYLDGQLFDFSEYRMTYDFDFREQSTTLEDGTPAKVVTHDCKAKYLGKDIYVALVDTVYQLK